MEAERRSTKILMLPWLAYGHITPFLELAKKLAKINFHIYICSSPVNLDGIKPKLSNENSIELIRLHIPPTPELPPHMHTTKGIPLHLEHALIKAFDAATPDFSRILQNLRPDLVISDLFQPWAVEAASSLNIPVVNFIVTGASPVAHMVHCIRNRNQEFPFPEFDFRDHWISTTRRKTSDDLGRESAMRFMKCMDLSSEIVLANTATEIEEKHISYLASLLKKKIIPIAPLVQELALDDEKSEIIEWLDKKSPKSTVYVSFGSEYYLSKEDREELAYGLEQSGANFVWVLRFPKGEKIAIEEALPDGFLERVRERGFIVDGWAPQLQILAHPSVGGFVCHCGWNSVVESVVFGVPIIALPMQLDQPWHAKVAEAAGVGVEARRDDEGNVRREEVAKAIKEVVFEKRGDDLSRKGREVGSVFKKKGREIIEGLAAELEKLCDAGKVC